MAERQLHPSAQGVCRELIPAPHMTASHEVARHPSLILPEISSLDSATHAFIQLRMDQLRLVSDVFTPLVYGAIGKQFGLGYPMGPEDGICLQYAQHMAEVLESIGYIAVQGIHDNSRSSEHRAVLCQRAEQETDLPEPVFLMDGTFKQYRVGIQAPDQMILYMHSYRTIEQQLERYGIPPTMHSIWMNMGAYLPQLSERRPQ